MFMNHSCRFGSSVSCWSRLMRVGNKEWRGRIVFCIKILDERVPNYKWKQRDLSPAPSKKTHLNHTNSWPTTETTHYFLLFWSNWHHIPMSVVGDESILRVLRWLRDGCRSRPRWGFSNSRRVFRMRSGRSVHQIELLSCCQCSRICRERWLSLGHHMEAKKEEDAIATTEWRQ